MKVVIDASRLDEKDSAQRYLKEILELSDYYGMNLDALHDCLSEADNLEIEMIRMEEAGNYAGRVLRVIRDAAKENPQLHFLEIES